MSAPVKERYRIIQGLHYQENPEWDGKKALDPSRHILMRKGDVIESDRDLSKVYINKFEKIINEAPTIVSSERKAAVATLIDTGVWTEEDRDFLEHLADDGFSRIVRQAGPRQTIGRFTSPLGEDVTESFIVASQEGFRVFCNPSGKYQVTTAANTTKPVNPKSLSEKEVDSFVVNFLKEKK